MAYPITYLLKPKLTCFTYHDPFLSDKPHQKEHNQTSLIYFYFYLQKTFCE